MRGGVLPATFPAYADLPYDRPDFATSAAPPEADTANGAHAEIVAVQRDADGLDRNRMEHERQSRLRRWQRQQDTR